MQKKDYIVLLGANQYLRERALAGARESTNAEVWIADINGFFNKNRYFDGCLSCDVNDYEGIIESIEKNESMNILSVIPLNDWVLETANKVNRYFGLKNLSNDTTENSRNKYKMKLRFMECNVPVANFYLLNENDGDDKLTEAINKIGFPLIIKPSDFGGSGGVYVAKNLNESKAFLSESKDIIKQHKGTFKIKGDEYLIEEYINSREEVSVEVICFNSNCKTVSVTEKYLSSEPWFSEVAHLVPSHRNNNPELNSIAHQACKALGIKFGMAHVEIKIKNGKYYVIEVAARPGGDGIMDQIETAFGINPYMLHILSYLGVDATGIEIPMPKGTAAISFLKAEEGVIKRINLPPVDMLPPNVVSLSISAKEGNGSIPPKNWSAREGVVEFFWMDTFFNEKTNIPIEMANELSVKIFEME